jgi:hypothetical protein
VDDEGYRRTSHAGGGCPGGSLLLVALPD